MENVFDFLRAALPWIVMGLLLAVFAARSAGKKKKEKEIDNYGIEGMCLGMCFDTFLMAFGSPTPPLRVESTPAPHWR